MLPDPLQRPTWAEIDLANLIFNYRSVRDFVGREVGFMAVVKADAYGHGAVECSRRLEAAGVEWLAVATVEEGIELRKHGIEAPILVLGGFYPGQVDVGVQNRLTPTVFTLAQAESINARAKTAGRRIDIHVKLDSGMGRIGFRTEIALEVAEKFAQLTHVSVEGLMTHFASADDLGSDLTERQVSSFTAAVKAFEHAGHAPRYIDLANSPAAVSRPATRSNLVRIGGILYGLGGDVLPAGVEKPELRPVMSVRTQIAQLKTVPAGESIGYGGTFPVERQSLIATVPIGYNDGVRRSLSNVGRMLVRGIQVPIAGRVSMDWTTIDVTGVPGVEEGDPVTVLGRDGGNEILAEDIARELDTISYDVTCGITRRVPRFYLDSTEP